MTSILRDDLEYITKAELPWEMFRDSSVLVTGATGLIGSLVVKALIYASEKRGLNITIFAAVRDMKRAQGIFDGVNIKYISGDIRAINCQEKLDYIIHCAAATKSSQMIADPAGNIKTAVNGTINILEMAKTHNIKSMVYISSMEVYGVSDADILTEDMLGFVDLTSPRSCYPEGKRMCELLCACYLHQYGAPVKIARLAQTFGAGVSRDESRVFAQFARSVSDNTDIILHTRGDGMGNYCYTADSVIAILLLLLRGKNGETYNVANEQNAMTVREMAELVADKVAGGKISVRLDIPKDNCHGYAPPVRWMLCADKIKALGWRPEYSMLDMYCRMIEDWREQA